MGKKKAKRVKKAWRNISTEDIDQFNEQTTRDANSGGSLASAPDDSLFVLDKSTDIPVKRKIEKNRDRVVRFESILQPNPFVKPVPSSKLRKVQKKGKVNAVEGRKTDESENKDGKALQPGGVYDLWDNEGADNIKRKKNHKPSAIPAVEVEPNGCSYNPENESHKDSLAQAVAQEMKKVYKTELEPQPIPLVIRGEAISEEDKYFLEVDHADDEEMEEEEAVNGDTEVEKRNNNCYLNLMSAKEQPWPPVLKLKTLNKGLKLAEQWVKNMPGQAGEETGQLDMEGRPAGLGLGARVLPKSHLGPSNDPLERKLMRHLGVGKKKPVADEETKLPAKRLDSDDDDDEENLESRTNAFAKKRVGSHLLMPLSKKKSKR